MTRFDDLDRALTSWFEGEAASPAPSGLLDQVTRATARRRPRPGFVASMRVGSAGSVRVVASHWTGPRRSRMALILIAAAMLVVIAAVAGSGAGSKGFTSQAPTPAPSSTPLASLAPGASAPAATGPVTLKPGEPWLLYAWYPASLYIVRPDGSDRHQLDLGVSGEPVQPSWSADGTQIAFVLRDRGKTPRDSIWTVNADGSGAALFYDGNGACDDGANYPVWSPDGKRMALVCYSIVGGTSISTVAVLDLATMQKTELVRLAWPEFIDNPPSWSPDGKTLAFDILTWDPTNTSVTSQLVATVLAAGGTVERLTDPAMFGAHPHWSPDGTLIAFNTYDTGNVHGISESSNVYTIKPDGTALRQLSTASTDGTMRIGQPFWSADGTRIWVSVARDYEKDSTGIFRNTLGWIDAVTGTLHEIGTEGRPFIERPGDG